MSLSDLIWGSHVEDYAVVLFYEFEEFRWRDVLDFGVSGYG
jgi:hypothetical protein